MIIQGHFLVRGSNCIRHGPPVLGSVNGKRMDSNDISSNSSSDTTGSIISKSINGGMKTGYVPMFITDTPISFWGGIDPVTGMVIDTTHPLYNTCITDSILCIPSTRGSCTTSQVLLELILNHTGPNTIIVRDPNDALLCIGAMIAQEFFPTSKVCDIICIGPNGYQTLLDRTNTNTNTTTATGTTKTSNVDALPQQMPWYGRVSSNGELHVRMDSNEMTEMVDSTFDETRTDDILSQQQEEQYQHRLSDEEQEYMDQCTTDAERMALRVIFRYAKLSATSSTLDTMTTQQQQQPRRYIPIQQSHIDGCTYIGPGGLQFVQRLQHAGGRVKVPTTLNAVSTDRRYWQSYHVPHDYAHNAIALGDAYIALGCQPTFTCAPYLLLPSSSPVVKPSNTSDSVMNTTSQRNSSIATVTSVLMGQDIAWGESNAVVYANSILGARTEKYADYLDICCAITGIVPNIGVHTVTNRIPTMLLDGTSALQMIQSYIDTSQENDDSGSAISATRIIDLDVLFPILGHLCGRLSDGQVPLLMGFEKDIPYWSQRISTDHLKSFCAAFGTTASSPLIHIAGITPEATDVDVVQKYISACSNSRSITLLDLYETFHQFNTNVDGTESVDLIALGNPHLSISECSDLAQIIQQVTTSNQCNTDSSSNDNDVPVVNTTMTKSPVKAQSRIIACISREIYQRANPNDIRIMLEFGVEFMFDTCWCMILNEPIIPHNPLAVIFTNSGKYAHYGPGLTKRSFRFGSMYDCIYAARYGYSPHRIRTFGMESFESKTLPSSSSSSATAVVHPNHRKNMDPYLSYLIRPVSSSSSPSTQYNHPGLPNQVRRYSTGLYVRDRETLNVTSKLTVKTKRSIVYTVSSLMKQYFR
jgi:cis-L-3-hydroxyproline dehydratase